MLVEVHQQVLQGVDADQSGVFRRAAHHQVSAPNLNDTEHMFPGPDTVDRKLRSIIGDYKYL